MVTGIIMTVVFDNFVCQYILRTLTNSVVYVTQCEKPNQAYIRTHTRELAGFKKIVRVHNYLKNESHIMQAYMHIHNMLMYTHKQCKVKVHIHICTFGDVR